MRSLSVFLIICAICASSFIAMTGEESAVAKAQKEVRAELGEGFAIEVVEEWFVTAANGGDSATADARETTRHVVQSMGKHFFTKPIDFPIKVYLFKDKESYEAYNIKRDGEKPSTPYGFYRSSDRTMVMNIATGLGTLSHELVHPLLAQDFPGVPAWFNEGFASLFECFSYGEDDCMKGHVNWRLPNLQKAIAEKKTVPLKELMATTTNAFYDDNRGLNYAEARYLCLYLQEKHLLQPFYKEFKAGFEKEKTGVAALEKVCGKKLAELEAEWLPWVGKLRWR